MIKLYYICFFLLSQIVCDIDRGLSQDFLDWLDTNGYSSYGFNRSDLDGGAYGGKDNSSQQIVNTPIIFVHGNSDIAVGVNTQKDWQTGFTKSIEFFLSKGYTKGELYITTWGPGDYSKVSDQTHSEEYLTYLRQFTEAVLNYTQASKVSFISHSMGVTLARQVIKGGDVTASENPFNLGEALTTKVDTFLGIAGGNWGLTNCFFDPIPPCCGNVNGFYPGYLPGPIGLSQYLDNLNNNADREGMYVYTMLSLFDDAILYGDLVWGRYTSQIPNEDGSKIYDTPKYSHIALRDDTCDEQYQIVTSHKISESDIQTINFLS